MSSGNIDPNDWFRRFFNNGNRFGYSGFSDNDFFNINPFRDFDEIRSQMQKMFDEFNDSNNDCSLFNNTTAWEFSNKTSNFFIFKTELSGILIEDFAKYKNENREHKMNILIPFIRYLPLIEVENSEIERCSFIKLSEINICK